MESKENIFRVYRSKSLRSNVHIVKPNGKSLCGCKITDPFMIGSQIVKGKEHYHYLYIDKETNKEAEFKLKDSFIKSCYCKRCVERFNTAFERNQQENCLSDLDKIDQIEADHTSDT